MNERMIRGAQIQEIRRVIRAALGSSDDVMQVLAPAHAIRGDHRLTTAAGTLPDLGSRGSHAGATGPGALADTAER
jgi:hypothetical protein